MVEAVDPGGLASKCEELQYPLMRADAAAAFADVTVEVGDGEENLGVVISELGCDSFRGPEELYDCVTEALPEVGST